MVNVVKQRRGRRTERGAAVFIVVMVITLLTGIGVFAARSASLVDMAAGYSRQSIQTQLVSELAGRFMVAELGSGAAPTYLTRLKLGTDVCMSNGSAVAIDPTATLACKTFTTDDIQATVARNFPSGTLFSAPTTTAAGSFGPQAITGQQSSVLEGAIQVELIDAFVGELAPGSPSGGGFADVQFTVTAYAQIRNTPPGGPGNAWCTPTTASGASVQALRTHVTVPNIPRL